MRFQIVEMANAKEEMIYGIADYDTTFYFQDKVLHQASSPSGRIIGTGPPPCDMLWELPPPYRDTSADSGCMATPPEYHTGKSCYGIMQAPPAVSVGELVESVDKGRVETVRALKPSAIWSRCVNRIKLELKWLRC